MLPPSRRGYGMLKSPSAISSRAPAYGDWFLSADHFAHVLHMGGLDRVPE